MSIVRIDESALLALGLDRNTVQAFRHMLKQVGPEVGASTLPQVALQTAQVPALVEKAQALGLSASLVADVATSGAAEVQVLTLLIPNALKAGALLSGRIVGTSSNGNMPGTLNLWLAMGGVKVLTHKFTTPEIIGTDKGFAADFTISVRNPGVVMAGGVLSLAYNAPTVLPAISPGQVIVPGSDAVTVALGMHWTATDPANIATAKVAFLSVDKL